MTALTLEERASKRKHPIGFVSALNNPIRSDPKPIKQPAPTEPAHPLEMVEALFTFSTLIGCAAASGQRRAKAAWDEITKARLQPPVQE